MIIMCGIIIMSCHVDGASDWVLLINALAQFGQVLLAKSARLSKAATTQCCHRRDDVITVSPEAGVSCVPSRTTPRRCCLEQRQDAVKSWV